MPQSYENPSNSQEPNDEDPGTPDPKDAAAPSDNDGGDGGNEPPADPSAGGEPDPNPSGDELPPEVARELLTKANNEAAKYRTQLRELQEQVKEMKSLDEVEALVAGLREDVEKNAMAAARERAGRKYGLPDAIVGRLSGSTEEEILADAEALAPLFGDKTPPPPDPLDPSGGRNPRNHEKEYDPAEEYAKTKRLRR